MNSVLVLMSTYNGEKYLSAQIYSLLDQNDVDINILIRDDGSKDSTIEIIKNFSQKYKNIKYYMGQNLGFANSFWNLILNAGTYDYYAFCDQDDIWDNRKISEAIKKIESVKNDVPILYTSNVSFIDSDGNKIKRPEFESGVLSVYQALQKSILPGCTFLFNYKAFNILKKYQGSMYAHDWATYIIISAFGKVIYDSKNYIYYRVHNNNTIGINNKMQFLAQKIKLLCRKSDCVRMHFAKDFYDTYNMDIKDDELKKEVYLLGHYQDCLKYKIKILFSKNFKGLFFKIYLILNRV